MDETLELVCDALDDLGEFVATRTTEKRLLIETQGWHSPALTAEELADIPRLLANQIRELEISDISDDLRSELEDVPHKLELVKQQTVPQFFGGNAPQSIPAYVTTIQWIQSLVYPLLYWASLEDSKAMPPHLAKRLRSVRKQLDDISVDKKELLSQIKLIQEATEAAESLPADLITLNEARKKITDLSDQAIKDSEKINELKEKSLDNEQVIDERIEQARKLINQCEEAYNITTTKGLAGAFEERAKKLSASMWLWVVGLLGALVVGAVIGSERLKYLTTAMSAENPDVSIIVMQSILSILSVGAPLWFAWIATKQIGRVFRLSEDYAFKASVAKAYEGYRKEAARIDPVFEARLFSTALSRVEEAPLRLVDDENHGSPWHEFIASPAFQKALDNIPEFRDKFIQISKDGIDAVKSAVPRNKKVNNDSDEEEKA